MNNNNSNLWGHISELLFSVELFSESFPTFLAVFVCSLDKCNKNEKKKLLLTGHVWLMIS